MKKSRPKKFATFPMLLIWILISSPVHAEPQVEVVQNVPIETTLLVPGIRETAAVWIEMINRAKKTIDLEQFYVYSKPGEALEPVLAALKAAAKRGVQIRLLIDPKFYVTYPNDVDELEKLDNIKVKTIDFKSTGGIQHAKYFVVDGSESFVGSANFDWVALSHVHEVGLKITDTSSAQTIEAIFGMDWNNAMQLHSDAAEDINLNVTTQVVAPLSTDSALRIVASPESKLPQNVTPTLGKILGMIGSAKKSVEIQVYEYATKNFRSTTQWKVLDSALREAATRGVHVKLLVDKTSLKDGKSALCVFANFWPVNRISIWPVRYASSD